MFRCTILMTCCCFQVYGFNDVSTLEETVIMEVQQAVGAFSVTLLVQVNVNERTLFVVRLDGTSECYTYRVLMAEIFGIGGGRRNKWTNSFRNRNEFDKSSKRNCVKMHRISDLTKSNMLPILCGTRELTPNRIRLSVL